MNLRGLVRHLVHDQPGEIAEHDVHHGPQSGHGRAHADARESGFGDGRIENALGTELLHQAVQNLEGGAGFGDVLAHDEDSRVAAHLFGQRLAHGFAQRQLANCNQLLSGIHVLGDF